MRFIFMRRRFLVIFCMLFCASIPENAFPEVTLRYDSIWICEGDSFPLFDFMKNEVEVSVGYELVGWEDLDAEKVFSPEKDTTLSLVYRRKDSENLQRKTFSVKVRPKPEIQVASTNGMVCVGETFPDVAVRSSHCDRVYWQEEGSEIQYDSLSYFGVAQKGQEVRIFHVIGTNNQCATAANGVYAVKIMDASRFRLTANLPSGKISVCEDSVRVGDCAKPSLLKLSYADSLVSRYKPDEIPYTVSWKKNDGFTDGSAWVKSPYENSFRIEAKVVDPVCHSEVQLSETYSVMALCEESVHQSGISYSCVNGKVKIYWGADFNVETITFRSLDCGETFTLGRETLDEYDAETFKFAFRGSNLLCRKSESKEVEWEVRMENDSVSVVDTIVISPCPQKPPVARFECKDGSPYLHLASADPIEAATFEGGDAFLLEETPVRSDFQKSYPHSTSYTIDDELLKDTITGQVSLLTTSCWGDTSETRFRVDMHQCRPTARIYYGGGATSNFILQHRDKCLRMQCSNVKGEVPQSVPVDLLCIGDTVYLKFQGVGFEADDSYELTINSDADFAVLYPRKYEEKSKNRFAFNNVDKMTSTLMFVPKEDCVIDGELCGVPFSFIITTGKRIAEPEYALCRGESVDLNTLVYDSGVQLQWNVSETTVAPTIDTEYYLYGLSENGCLVDEKVMIYIDYSIWYKLLEDTLCEKTRVLPSDLLHTNARRIEILRDNEPLDLKKEYDVRADDELQVSLVSGCDSIRFKYSILTKQCEEEKVLEEDSTKIMDENNDEDEKDENQKSDDAAPQNPNTPLRIYTCFSPKTGGGAANWRIVGLEQYAWWRCEIYDRFGKKLKTYEKTPVVWDGTYQGNALPQTDYWYMLWVNHEPTPRMGHFTLLGACE